MLDSRWFVTTSVALVVTAVVLTMGTARGLAGDDEPDPLTRARNLGRAHFQNEHFAKAAEYFRQAVELAPQSAVDRINLAVAEAQAREDQRAAETIEAARSLESSYPQVLYLTGLVQSRLTNFAAAAEAYRALLALDPLCVPAHYGLGLALDRLGDKDEAVEEWERTIELDPDHGPTYYQLFRAYTQSGETERAQAAFEQFTRTREKGVGPGTSRRKMEQSRYFELIEEDVPPTASDAPPNRIPVTLTRATGAFALDRTPIGPASSPFVLGDVDNDGDLDLLLGSTLYLNEGDRFGAGEALPSISDVARVACMGDFDNDEKLDLVVAGDRLVLYRGDGLGSFEPLPSAALGMDEDDPTPTPWHDVRFVDIDHEGDLDILAVGAHRVHLLRNNGNATFTDVSDTSGMAESEGTFAPSVLSDLECDHDIDVFLAEAGGRHRLFVNERDGTFLDDVEASGLSTAGAATAAVASDVNNDGAPDLVLFCGRAGPVQVWPNHGGARFHRDGSSPVLDERTRDNDAESGCLEDLDNDGDLDLVIGGDVAKVFRNDGAGGWSDWTDAIGLAWATSVQSVLAGDLDGDGDTDLLLRSRSGKVEVARNDGGNANHRVRIRLAGTKNTYDGYGSKVWTRDGRFFQVRESFGRWIDLGVGDRTNLEVVGLRWPTGVTQNLIDVVVGDPPVIEITERPGFSESCPFVYAYDGTRFEFITDVLDVTPLGVSLVPGVPFRPNHRESILIDGTRLAPRGDLLSIRITQELQEITFLDCLRLVAVDHPPETVVVPNDRFSAEPFAPARIHVLLHPRPPQTAFDGRGRDVRAALLAHDRRYVDDCEPIRRQYPGVTTGRTLILDPGDALEDGDLMLFLRGTMLWTEASVNVAVSQNPDVDLLPVSLDVIGADGDWVRVRDDLGVPAGIDKFLPVDLDGVFPGPDRRLRISTNMAILWDQAFFATTSVAPPSEQTELDPLYGDLRHRGFSVVFSPDGNLPDLFDYGSLQPRPPFEVVHRGRYTRYGNVVELLSAADDRFVVMAPGDEVAVEFPAILLPDLPEGWARDYVLEVEGWIKDGDLRTRTGDTVEPFPFHAMTDYPWPATESYSADPLRARYLEDYQTRELPARVPSPRYP